MVNAEGHAREKLAACARALGQIRLLWQARAMGEIVPAVAPPPDVPSREALAAPSLYAHVATIKAGTRAS